MKRRITVVLVALICFGLSTAAIARTPDSYLCQVVLLVAGDEGGSSPDGLSKNARLALEDIQNFLPYKSYKLLDTALVRSNGRGQGRLNGPDGADYEVEFSFQSDPDTDQLLFHAFHLRDPGRSVAAAVASGDTTTGPAPAPRASRMLIQSSFSVKAGETIVVGSSKLNGGGKALLVLLTAIP